MRSEPKINKQELKERIIQDYGFIIVGITFVPEGEFSYSFILKESNGKKFFLKMYEDSRLINRNSGNFDFSWNVARKLDELGFKFLSKPIVTKKGNVSIAFESFKIVLWEFIEGKQVTEKERKSKEFMIELGKLLGTLHSLTDAIQLDDLVELDYSLDFRLDLLKSIKEATTCSTSKERYFMKLQRLIKQHMITILESLNYLEELAEKLKKRDDLDLVHCHSDTIRHNLIHEDTGPLILVDWDSVKIAPFEQDIWFYINDEFILEFIKNYKKKRQIKQIDEEVVVFLFYERTLADLTDWIYRILFEETSKKQMKSDFKGLEEDVWPILNNIKGIEEELRRKIRILNESD